MGFPEGGELDALFTLESEKGGVIDEPPFRILMLGDWSGHGKRRDLGERLPIEIDRDNFDDVMTKLGVWLEVEVEGNSLSLEFTKLDDFHPDEIFRQVPVFAELRDLRRRLKNPDTFNQAAQEVRGTHARAEQAETESQSSVEASMAPPAENLLDAILSEPGGGGAKPRVAPSGELGSLISDLVRPHLVLVDENEQAGLIAAVDEATGSLMRRILHHRAFQELEASWRGLYFQVRRTETSTDLKIYVLDLPKDEVVTNLKSANTLADSALYRHLVRDAIETSGGEPWAVVCGNYAFGSNVEDAAALIRVSKIAAAAGAPFISHMRPDVLGVHSLAAHPDPNEWRVSADTDHGKLWAALRSQPDSDYLGMAIPRFLARLPYGVDTEPLESFNFEEFSSESEHDNYVWANPCFAAALLLAQSYSRYSWEMGRSLLQDIEGLPVHVYKHEGETVFQPCAEILFTDRACDMLMNYGLMPLVSFKNTDRVKLARFQSITDPVTGLQGRWRRE